MKHAFTCTSCGQPLTQETILFDLMASENKIDSNRFPLYVQEKEIKKLCKHNRSDARHTLKLGWKAFLHILSNPNNLNCPELRNLKLKEANMIVEDELHKRPNEAQPPVFRRLRNSLPQSKGIYAYWIIKRMVEIFSKGEKIFHREIELEINNHNAVTGLKLYDGIGGDALGTSSRVCSRCKEPVFAGAGTARHAAVVFVSATERATELEGIMEKLKFCLLKGQNTLPKTWSAEEIEWNAQGNDRCSLTVKIHTWKEGQSLDDRYLTLALAQEEYRKQEPDKLCFFPDADAYVLCDANVGRKAVSPETEATKNKELIQYALLMQKQRKKQTKKSPSVLGYAPMLLLYGIDGTAEGSNPDEAGHLFHADWNRAENLEKCKAFRSSLEELAYNAYYTQLFYGLDNPEDCIERLVYWVLQTTGSIPVQVFLNSDMDEFRANAPICKSLMPDEQIKMHMKHLSRDQRYKVCCSEAKMRKHFFDNTGNTEQAYLESKTIEQMQSLTKQFRKQAKKKHSSLPHIDPEPRITPLPETIDDWQIVNLLIKRYRHIGAATNKNQLKVTFLIGNGFDVGMKMKSQYRDFYQLYTKKGSGYYPGDLYNKKFSDTELVNALIDAQADEKPDWSYYEKWLGDYTKENKFMSKTTRESLMKQNNNFQSMFFHYLDEREKKMVFSMSKGDVDENGSSLEDRLQNIRNTMLTALQSFYTAENIGTKSHKVINDVISKNAPSTSAHPDILFQFICYNYSGILRNCVNLIMPDDPDNCIEQIGGKIGDVHYVHGELKRSKETALVMGVNDSSQIGNPFTYQADGFTRKLIKWRIMDAQEHSEQYATGVRMIWESDIIVVYGMSLGITDKIWCRIIYQWLQENKEHHLIVYIHSAQNLFDPDNGDSKKKEWLKDFREMVWNESEKLCCDSVDQLFIHSCRYTNCPNRSVCEKWGTHKKQIHFSIGRDIFEMDLRIAPKEDGD